MNNNVNKLMVMALACAALCGTALAAPHGGNGGRAAAPARHGAHQKAPAFPKMAQHHARPETHHRARPANHAPAHRPAPVVTHCAPVRHVVVHAAPPPPPPPPPRPAVVVRHECHGEAGLGAVLGAVIGGIIGAAL